jgi:hypothetical protein
MAKPLVQRQNRIVSIRFFDRMLDRETRRLSRVLASHIAAAGGKVRLLLSVDTSSPGGGPEAMFEGLHFIKLHAGRIDRIALLGRKEWERTYAGLFSLFSGIEMAFFTLDEGVKAIEWLQRPDTGRIGT